MNFPLWRRNTAKRIFWKSRGDIAAREAERSGDEKNDV